MKLWGISSIMKERFDTNTKNHQILQTGPNEWYCGLVEDGEPGSRCFHFYLTQTRAGTIFSGDLGECWFYLDLDSLLKWNVSSIYDLERKLERGHLADAGGMEYTQDSVMESLKELKVKPLALREFKEEMNWVNLDRLGSFEIERTMDRVHDSLRKKLQATQGKPEHADEYEELVEAKKSINNLEPDWPYHISKAPVIGVRWAFLALNLFKRLRDQQS